MATGAELIAAERQRQIEVEGWTPEHDDEHENGEMIAAAVCYAEPTCGALPRWNNQWWPWADKWWKPSDDPIRDLAKAGALIAAEIDRRQRKQEQEAGRGRTEANSIGCSE